MTHPLHASRPANATDFWRGFALVSIFINHIAGNSYSVFTHRNYSISDAAELFVFLAGWSVSIAANKLPTRIAARKFLARAGEIYVAQMLIIVAGVAVLAIAAWAFQDPQLREWVNAKIVFSEPWRALLGLTSLTYHLSYLSVLPLYVVLMVLVPGIIALDRFAPSLVLPLSFAIYVATLIAAVPVPTWPDGGVWFFHPLSWQFLFVLGFVLAKQNGIGGIAHQYLPGLRLLALPVLAVSFVAMLFDFVPKRDALPAALFWLSDNKMFATPIRLIQFLALVAVFSAVFPFIRRYAPAVTEFGSRLGRNSLLVFSLGSLLSLGGELFRHVAGGNLTVDTLSVVIGIAVMGLAASLAERGALPSQLIKRPQPRQSPQGAPARTN